jgi:hypothetical protein
MVQPTPIDMRARGDALSQKSLSGVGVWSATFVICADRSCCARLGVRGGRNAVCKLGVLTLQAVTAASFTDR